MRLDRSITLNLVGPLRCLIAASNSGANHVTQRRQIPILMYHGISDEPESGVHPYFRTNTSPSRFREQIQFLAENGYRTLDLADAVNRLKNKSREIVGHHQTRDVDRLPPAIHDVVITFDDGFESFYAKAFPVLREFGFSATVFLPTGFIQERQASGNFNSSIETSESEYKVRDNVPVSGFRPRYPFLTWDEVRELRRAGISFGSHTVNHAKLVELDWPVIEYELRKSKSEIERQLAQPVHAFAYPYAFPRDNEPFIRRFKELLGEAGYDCCVTTEIGRLGASADVYQIKRIPVNSLDDCRLFRAKLGGNYDWLGVPQSVIKRFKSNRKRASILKGH